MYWYTTIPAHRRSNGAIAWECCIHSRNHPDPRIRRRRTGIAILSCHDSVVRQPASCDRHLEPFENASHCDRPVATPDEVDPQIAWAARCECDERSKRRNQSLRLFVKLLRKTAKRVQRRTLYFIRQSAEQSDQRGLDIEGISIYFARVEDLEEKMHRQQKMHCQIKTFLLF